VAAATGSAISIFGAYLFTDQLVSVQAGGVLLALAMVGAVVIARRRVLGAAAEHGEHLAGGVPPADEMGFKATPPSDDPHSIPISGTRNPEAKSYPEA
jgi:hypothetical protein